MIAELRSENLVLDLRYNEGGKLISANTFLGSFVPKGTFLGQIQYRDDIVDWTIEKDDLSFDGRIIVLISEFSASAAEVVAHTLREKRGATIPGSRSSGATLLALKYDLPDGGFVRVPVGQLKMVDGVDLEGVGVKPDIEWSPLVTNDSDEIFRRIRRYIKDNLSTGAF